MHNAFACRLRCLHLLLAVKPTIELFADQKRTDAPAQYIILLDLVFLGSRRIELERDNLATGLLLVLDVLSKAHRVAWYVK